MNPTRTTNLLLAIIALLLVALVLRPLREPEAVQAQSANSSGLYFEPGTYLLRAPDNSQQVYGKVVVDLRNGHIWGYPTLGPQPYPVDAINTKPQTSHPFLLGKFALEDMNK